MNRSDVEATVRSYLQAEVLPGESPDALQASTPLLSAGALDSIAMIKLVTFLEERFGIEIDAHEMTADEMDTLSAIADLVERKARGA